MVRNRPDTPARLVILDCDRTLWDHEDVSMLRLPFARVDPETVRDADGIRVRLNPGARTLLAHLRDRGILISIASWNHPEPVFAIFALLDLEAFFAHPKVEFHPHKDQMVARLLAELAADGTPVRPDEIVYVDDNPTMLAKVRAAFPAARTLQAGVNVRDLREVVPYVEGRARWTPPDSSV
jgi:magnesium-dependent phosphatase-1